jgi:hypothetical protein
VTTGPIREVGDVPFSWPDRTFYLHAYYDGHDQLVVRSPRHEPNRQTHEKRIDILFKGVAHVDLPTTMPGLTLRRADATAWATRLRETGIEVEPGTQVFIADAVRWSGFVAALAAYTADDDAELIYTQSALSRDFEIRFVPTLDPDTTYLKVVWHHTLPDEPVLIYSEVRAGREQRKVEIFRDGRMDFANDFTETGTTLLAQGLFPSFNEIVKQPEFSPLVIGRDEFDIVWESATQTAE